MGGGGRRGGGRVRAGNVFVSGKGGKARVGVLWSREKKKKEGKKKGGLKKGTSLYLLIRNLFPFSFFGKKKKKKERKKIVSHSDFFVLSFQYSQS